MDVFHTNLSYIPFPAPSGFFFQLFFLPKILQYTYVNRQTILFTYVWRHPFAHTPSGFQGCFPRCIWRSLAHPPGINIHLWRTLAHPPGASIFISGVTFPRNPVRVSNLISDFIFLRNAFRQFEAVGWSFSSPPPFLELNPSDLVGVLKWFCLIFKQNTLVYLRKSSDDFIHLRMATTLGALNTPTITKAGMDILTKSGGQGPGH